MMDLKAELKGTYEIISTENNFELRIVPHVTWSYFNGHFPSQPILPAVGIADISRYFIETYFFEGQKDLKSISQFRIRTPVQPGQKMRVIVEKDSATQFHIVWKNETEHLNSAELNLEWF